MLDPALLGVADLAGFVDVLAGEADLGSVANVPVCNVGNMLVAAAIAAVPSNLSRLLCCAVPAR